MALDREQLRNARIIYEVGKSMGLGVRDIQIGLITAMQESSLRNLNYGDRDSLGLFQQRPSMGWGTPSQVTDPVYAAKKFFTTLKGVENRYGMSMTQAAQAVQRSAYPDAYAKHIPLIRSIYPDISNSPKNRNAVYRPGIDPEPVMHDGVYREGRDTYRMVDLDFGDDAGSMGSSLDAALSAASPLSLAAPDTLSQMGSPEMDGDWFPIINKDSLDQIAQDAPESVGFQKGLDNWRAAVISAAKSALGTPYVWGGNSLSSGVDCSGLLQQAFAKAGIDLPRVSYQQANAGTRISLKALKPGDLVAWDNSSRNNGADHIALYVGNGRIIEAPRPGTNVRIRRLGDNEGAWGVRIKR